MSALCVVIACMMSVLTGVLVWDMAERSPIAEPVAAVRAVTDEAAVPATAQTIGTPAVAVRAHWEWESQRRDGVIAVPAGTPAGSNRDIPVDENGDWAPAGAAFGGPIPRVGPAVLLAMLVGVGGIVVIRQVTRRAVEQRHDRYWTEQLARFFATRPD
ncbi:hypothetical protein C7458_101616 [Williamsia muralis]|nr:hypothetical protein C7458_101616 [Williamsia marianensis]